MADDNSTAAKLRLIYVKKNTALYQPISINILREICQYLDCLPLLPVVPFRGGVIVVHNLQSATQWTLTCSEAFPLGCAYLFLKPASLFCVGKSLSPSSVFTTNLKTAEVTEQPKTLENRKWPGIVQFQQVIYLFGGNPTNTLKSCERFSLQSRAWTPCAEMQIARNCFTPCVHRNEVYLPDSGPPSKQLEVYSPALDQYRSLPLTLSSQMFGSVSVIVGEELIVVNSSNMMYSWRLSSERNDPQSIPHEAFASDNGYTNSSPTLYGDFAYWPDGGGAVMQLDLKRRVLIERS